MALSQSSIYNKGCNVDARPLYEARSFGWLSDELSEIMPGVLRPRRGWCIIVDECKADRRFGRRASADPIMKERFKNVYRLGGAASTSFG